MKEGGSYQADAADYESAHHIKISDAATYAGASTQGDTKIILSTASGNQAGEEIHGRVSVYGPALTTNHHAMWEIALFDDTATPLLRMITGVGAYNANTNAITGVRFMGSTGNITSGTINLYGLRK